MNMRVVKDARAGDVLWDLAVRYQHADGILHDLVHRVSTWFIIGRGLLQVRVPAISPPQWKLRGPARCTSFLGAGAAPTGAYCQTPRCHLAKRPRSRG